MEVSSVVLHSIPESPQHANADVGIQSSPTDEPDVVILDDILDVADRVVNQFEKLIHSHVSHPKPEVPAKCVCNGTNTWKCKLPVFSDESSKMEYSSDSASGLSISSPTFLKTIECATSGYVGIYDVVLIHLSSDSDCRVDID